MAHQNNLIGLRTVGIQWYHQGPQESFDRVTPAAPSRGLRRLSSDLVMPPCLTPRRYTEGPRIGHLVQPGESPKHEHWWDEGGLAPAILRFNRKSVEALGPFDVALTRENSRQLREYVGARHPAGFVKADSWAPEIIVSQRFRKWVRRSGVRGGRKFTFDVVELVDD